MLNVRGCIPLFRDIARQIHSGAVIVNNNLIRIRSDRTVVNFRSVDNFLGIQVDCCYVKAHTRLVVLSFLT